MMYKEKIAKLNREAFEATKKMLMESGERCCVYVPDRNDGELAISISGVDDFEAIVYDGSFVDDMRGYVCRGVRLLKGGNDPYGGWRTLEIRITNCNGVDSWIDVSSLNPLCYADMYEFVKNHIADAITADAAKGL